MESDKLNDELCLENLICVVNKTTGQATDVRTLLGLTNDDIKDLGL